MKQISKLFLVAFFGLSPLYVTAQDTHVVTKEVKTQDGPIMRFIKEHPLVASALLAVPLAILYCKLSNLVCGDCIANRQIETGPSDSERALQELRQKLLQLSAANK